MLTISAVIPPILRAIFPDHFIHWESLIVFNITVSGLYVLLSICKPFSKYTTFVAVVGVACSLLASLALPDVFFNPGYLKTANNITEQLNLIFNDFFNMNLYKSIDYAEWITFAIYLVLCPFILYGLIKIKDLIIKNKAVIISTFKKIFKSKKA